MKCFKGFQIGNNLSISHLLFVDDTLIFCKSNESNLGNLRCIIFLFEAMSDLRVNLSKNVLILISEVPQL